MNQSNINKIVQSQIDAIASKCADIKPLVVIRCITYNHEPYLRDALEGFVMQKTDFPFVAIVHDDASTDGTAKIIREYAEKFPDIILPIYETENQYSKRDESLDRIMRAACDASDAKYYAWCEGDDYWIDPMKLQKQVEALEQNPEASGCYSSFILVDESSCEIHNTSYENNIKRSFTGNVFLELLRGNFIQTCTFICRKDSFVKSTHFEHCKWKIDYYIFLTVSVNGKLVFIPENTAAYRQTSTGQMGSNIKNVINLSEEIFLYFIDNYYSDVSEAPTKIRIPLLKKLFRIEHKKKSTYHFRTVRKIWTKNKIDILKVVLYTYSIMAINKVCRIMYISKLYKNLISEAK